MKKINLAAAEEVSAVRTPGPIREVPNAVGYPPLQYPQIPPAHVVFPWWDLHHTQVRKVLKSLQLTAGSVTGTSP